MPNQLGKSPVSLKRDCNKNLNAKEMQYANHYISHSYFFLVQSSAENSPESTEFVILI